MHGTNIKAEAVVVVVVVVAASAIDLNPEAIELNPLCN
jgi:hypothetical protein